MIMLPRAILFDLDDTILQAHDRADAAWRVVCPVHLPTPRSDEVAPGIPLASIDEQMRTILGFLDRAAFDRTAFADLVGKRLASDVLYLRLKQFQEGTHRELLEAVGRARQESSHPFTGVLLDMRSNPGGLVDEASEVADEFLAGGTVYSTRHRGQVVEQITARGGGALAELPMTVLVNEYSASAAELVAGALQDNRRATIVGAPTFGKGSVQSIVDLPGGAGLKLTTMRYYTPSGHSIQAQGIQPDILVESSRVATAPSRVTRERDLEGHLPAEGETTARNTAPVYRSPAPSQSAKGADPEPGPRTAADVPSNPVGGPDFALSIAYQVVRGVLTPKK